MKKLSLNLLQGVRKADTSESKLFKKIISLVLGFLLASPFLANYQIIKSDSFHEEILPQEDINLIHERSETIIYAVQPGDTLSSVAKSFNLKKESLMVENDLWNPNRLRAGMEIKILPVDGLSHIVKKGENLEKIAKRYEIDKEKIIEQNNLEGESLAVGVSLIIPEARWEIPVYTTISAPVAPIGKYTGSATGRLLRPAKGEITQGYRRGHAAIDIATRAKGPIYSAASGKVIKAQSGWNGGYGNMIIIDHGNGMQTLYGHNEKLYVTVGQQVEQGQTIAWMGNSGRVYGPTGIHLHFEVRIRGIKYNPINFF